MSTALCRECGEPYEYSYDHAPTCSQFPVAVIAWTAKHTDRTSPKSPPIKGSFRVIRDGSGLRITKQRTKPKGK